MGDGRRGIRVTGNKKKVTNSGKNRKSLSVRFGFSWKMLPFPSKQHPIK
jgi:hypothetical protein